MDFVEPSGISKGRHPRKSQQSLLCLGQIAAVATPNLLLS